MSKRIIISEEEKNEILNQHTSYKKSLFVEQTKTEFEPLYKAFQDFLRTKKLYNGQTTGIWDEASTNALKIYQRNLFLIDDNTGEKRGIKEDGKVGSETLKGMKYTYPNDLKFIQDKKAQYGDFIDKILHFFGIN